MSKGVLYICPLKRTFLKSIGSERFSAKDIKGYTLSPTHEFSERCRGCTVFPGSECNLRGILLWRKKRAICYNHGEDKGGISDGFMVTESSIQKVDHAKL